MWLDNASNIDMLFYSPYADTIANFAKEEALSPLTIGLYGSWGAGKSSLLNLIEDKINGSEKTACIVLNAWQFEGYEDAKIAIMESLLKAIKENETFWSKAKEKIKRLLSRIDFLKLGKDIAIKGAPIAIGALTGNPIPLAVSLSAELSNVENAISSLDEFKNNYIKQEENKPDSLTDNIRKFRIDFENMLEEVTDVESLVVIVDDLDRCTPERIIDTLEAIKLFLSVKKTTFIVAVDERIIRYAVNVKYPQADGFSVSEDYIEKIVQLPIKIPELSPKDIENYLILLICQLHLSRESFKELIPQIYESKIMLSDKAITLSDINGFIKSINATYAQNYNEKSLMDDIEIISKINTAVSSSLKGNPRQTKRFLNTFFVRKNLAKLYFGDELDLSIMAKLLVLETIDNRAFKKLYEWNSGFDGEIKELKQIETCVADEKEIPEDFSMWNNPRIIHWVKSQPINLHKKDLSKYFYLSRESLNNSENITASFDDSERKLLSDIINCIQGQEEARFEELKTMGQESQKKICEALIVNFKTDSVNLSIMSRIFVEYKEYRNDIVTILKQKPKEYFNMSTVPLIKIMRKNGFEQINTLLDDLEKDKKINSDYKKLIIEDGGFLAARRR